MDRHNTTTGRDFENVGVSRAAGAARDTLTRRLAGGAPALRKWMRLGVGLLLVLAVSASRAAETRSFTEGRSGGGELKYINDLPVLIVAGTPEEMGRQTAALTGDVVKKLAEYPRKLVERRRNGKEGEADDRLAKCLEMSKSLLQQVSADHRAEMRAAFEQLKVDREMGILGNVLPDVYRGGFSCSSIVVEADHSATGGPLFGRNLDFYTLGMLTKYSLVTVRRPTGKHAFVAIGFPGMFGVLTGMNDAGLAVAVHEVFKSRDGGSLFNPKGEPYTFCFRRVLEECSTVAEAEKLLRDAKRTTLVSLSVCDPKDDAVFEITPKSVAVRRSSRGILACTNHFRTTELASPFMMKRPLVLNAFGGDRYQELIQARKLDRVTISDVAKKLDAVQMAGLTVQTMIFEPATLKLHLAIGACPSSALPMKELELKPLLKR
jgi:isopenicillin-N N-acyltransferase like protein